MLTKYDIDGPDHWHEEGEWIKVEDLKDLIDYICAKYERPALEALNQELWGVEDA